MYIKDQITSILNQRDVDFELNIYDDNSTDSTIKICENINDYRITIHHNKKNTGSAAINFLNALCSIDRNHLNTFDYVAFSDQDDIWDENKLKEATLQLEFNNAHLYASNLTLWNMSSNKYSTIHKSYKQTKFDYLFEGASAGCTYVFSLNLANSFIEYVINLDLTKWKNISHDWILYFYARTNNFIVFIDNNSYITYRIHNNNVHGSLNIISFNSILKKINLIRSGWFENHFINFKNHFLNNTQIEHLIYSQYLLNWYSRMHIIIKYNFKFFRTKRKFIYLFCLNLFNFHKS